MIDTIYQDGTDAVIRDRLQRPQLDPQPSAGTFAGFWRAAGGVPAGVLDLGASASDVAAGVGQVTQRLGLRPPNDSGLMTAADFDAGGQLQDAAGGPVDWNAPWSGGARATAKSLMPDPESTGAATQITAGLLHFGVQAIPLMAAAGPIGPVAVGGVAGAQEADKLREEGVDLEARTRAAEAAGVGAGASMVLPMSGASRAIRAAKGAAGGAASMAAQAEAERLILQHAGYDKIASQYDPLDPTTLALAAVVPAVFGAAFGHNAPIARDQVLTEPQMADAVKLTPEEQARSDAFEASAGNLVELRAAIAAEKSPESRATLQAELDRLTAAHRAAARAAENPDVVAAARVHEVADALEASRLTPEDDLVGADQHQRAIETALDQMAAGERVDVSDLVRSDLPPSPFTDAQVEIESGGKRVEVPGLTAAFDNGAGSQGVMDLAIRDGRLYPAWVDNGRIPMGSSSGGRTLALYERAIEEAHRRGLEFTSDSSVSASAERIYDALERRGYEVERNPTARETATAEAVTPRLVTDDGSPVFRVKTQPADRTARAARALDELRSTRTPADADTDAAGVSGDAAVGRAAFDAERAERAGQASQERAVGSPGEPAAAPAARGPLESAGPDDASAPAGAPAPGGEPSRLQAAVDAIAAESPELLVQLDGMPHAVPISDLLAAVRQAADDEIRDASLLEVAANCSISN